MNCEACLAEPPDVSARERASHDTITRIRKLRWMGLEREAQEVEEKLRRIDPACAPRTAGPDTD